MDKAARLEYEKFDKLKFVFVFQSFQNLMSKSITIQHVFKLKSSVFFNSDMMLDKIDKKQA